MVVKSDTSGVRVFVYGSLKQGQVNNRVLADAELLGRCYLEGKYTMVDLGWYPAVIPGGDTERRIFGEVYRISEDHLDALDMIEGHPTYYERHKINTPWKNAWCYFLPDDYLSAGSEIESGMWNPIEEELDFERGCPSS